MRLATLLTKYYSSLPRVMAVCRPTARWVLQMALPDGNRKTFVVPDAAYLHLAPGDGQGLLSLIVWEHPPDLGGQCGQILLTATVGEDDRQTQRALGW